MNAMLGGLYTDAVASIADHLWQSTLFAIAIAMLAVFVLRHNRATERYWLWLAASLKFLVPFSVLMSAGNRLGAALSYELHPGWWAQAVVRVSEPFAQQVETFGQTGTMTDSFTHLPATLWLLGLWASGVLATLAIWYWRWQAIARAIGEAVPMRDSIELTTLRALERQLGVRKPITMLQSASSLEPGVVGIFKPVLLWPVGISSHLAPEHLQAVIAHEVWHVRRRDNLAAALHMLVEAVFWFHPLVWWLGARLVHERERACDEKVLELGSERAIYAESILKTCRFCVSSPLPMLSGVTGAQLKQRIIDIMTGDPMRAMGFSRKLVLSSAGMLALAAPTMYGMVSANLCQGTDYIPAARPIMCDLLDGRQKALTGDLSSCRQMADELLGLPQLPDSMAVEQQDQGIQGI
jgi:beta-lactamase regulating signal transducer with metallopeptidase domain